MEKQASIWNRSYLESIGIQPEKDLTARFPLEKGFRDLRMPLDFSEMAEIIEDKYTRFKVPKALLKSLSEFFGKSPEEIDFVDLTQMYYSILYSTDKPFSSKNLTKWKKANKLSYFGIVQYRLMENYFEKKRKILLNEEED